MTTSSAARLLNMNRLIEVVADAVIAIDVDQRIVFFNAGAESIFGYARDEALGQQLHVLLPERYAEIHSRHIAGFLASPETSRLMGERQAIYARRKSGEEFPAEASISKINDEGTQTMVVLLRDVSERQRLESALRQQAEQIAVAGERSRLARDLHDAVSQTLFSASLIADVLPRLWNRNAVEAQKRLDELKSLNRGALAEMRMLLLELRPTALVESRFADLLTQICLAAAGRTGIHVEVEIAPQLRDARLQDEAQVALYRIAQESLNNIIKHSEAKHVWVRLGSEPEGGAQALLLSIRDDGRGFDPGTNTHEHLGLRIMNERAQSLKAEIVIASTPGAGTEIRVRAPVHFR